MKTSEASVTMAELLAIHHAVAVFVDLYENLLELHDVFVLQLQGDHVAYYFFETSAQVIVSHPIDYFGTYHHVSVFLVHQPLDPRVMVGLVGSISVIGVSGQQL